MVSVLGLTFGAPLLFVLMFGAWLSTRASPFFVQRRIGWNGRPFAMVKIRSMDVARDTRGVLLPDAQRIGGFGRWLRSTSLDELPELAHVLLGQMSLVGPRPLLPEYLPLYTERQARRHDVRPGMTGWAQVNGRNTVSWPDRLEMDVWYVEHRSLALDLHILWLTLARVVRREGITPTDAAAMPPFTGAADRSARPQSPRSP